MQISIFPVRALRVVVAVGLLYAGSAIVPVTASAQSQVAFAVNAGSQAQIEAFWTPERLMSARPLELHPVVGPSGFPSVSEAEPKSAPSVSSPGAPPSVDVGPNQGRLLIPHGYGVAPELSEIPEGTSSYGAYFTTGRVFPDAATTSFPYRAAGKLFFHDPRTGGNFVCSASVLRVRVIVTAGHCVAHPSTSAASRYFFNNFMFVPAYNNGAAPYRSWTWSRVFTTNTWYLSSGAVPNAQDVGMINPPDQKFGTVTSKIGQVTGYLGYLTNSLAKNNVTMLGYPTNLDSGSKMEITNAQTYIFGGNNTYIYGSAMRGGSSGGPWIQDFGVRPTGTPPNTPPVLLGNNNVVAVTSYGPIATTPAYQGASNLNTDFVNLLNAACAPPGSGNC